MYKVEDNIEIPHIPARGRKSKYDFPKLKVGQSFVVSTAQELQAARFRFVNRDGLHIKTRKVPEGFRIWRVGKND